MAFTMSLDDFIITHFTRGAGINTLSTLIYSEVRRGIQPSMYALSTVIFVTVLALLLISNFSPENQSGIPADKVQETMKKRRRNNNIRKVCLVFAAFAIVASVSFTAYKKYSASHSDELYVYNWGEYIDPEVIELFEEETGIHVTYDMFETNEEMYPVIEAGAVCYDVVCPSDYMIQKMAENGLLAEINFDNIPNISNIDPLFLEKSRSFDPQNRYSVPYTWGTVGILYNTKRIEELGAPSPDQMVGSMESGLQRRNSHAGLCTRCLYGCVKVSRVFHEYRKCGRTEGSPRPADRPEAAGTGLCNRPGP